MLSPRCVSQFWTRRRTGALPSLSSRFSLESRFQTKILNFTTVYDVPPGNPSSHIFSGPAQWPQHQGPCPGRSLHLLLPEQVNKYFYWSCPRTGLKKIMLDETQCGWLNYTWKVQIQPCACFETGANRYRDDKINCKGQHHFKRHLKLFSAIFQ